jgi:hypothetical protein
MNSMASSAIGPLLWTLYQIFRAGAHSDDSLATIRKSDQLCTQGLVGSREGSVRCYSPAVENEQ